jgi:hypothetical protein
MKKISRRSVFLGAVVALFGAGTVKAAVCFPAVTPNVVEAGVQTQVTVTCNITQPGLVPGSVVLLQLSPGGGLTHPTNLGSMIAAAGSTIYSKTVTLTGSLGPNNTNGGFVLRVAANFAGTAGQVETGDLDILVVKGFISDFTPGGIQTFLNNNAGITSAAAFLQYLDPVTFKRDWILMTNSASSQGGTAACPRVIVQSVASDRVFGLLCGGSFGTQIEYIQWNATNDNKFHFHLIDAAAKSVIEDDKDCLSCHSAKVAAWPYPRPNWDAYDSWGGALPYNRDRIYGANSSAGPLSAEATAMANLFKNLDDGNDSVFTQLDLPPGVTRDSSGNVVIPFNVTGIGSPDTGTGILPVTYNAPNGIIPVYPGDTTANVAQGGPFYLMQSTANTNITVGAITLDRTDPVVDGGRGVAMFDHFSAFNAQRVAQELAGSVGQTTEDSVGNAVDLRYIALAIASGCVDSTNFQNYAPQPAITRLLADEKMANFAALQADTNTRQHSLPQMKANQEASNLAGLLAYVSGGPNPVSITDQVARRSKEPGPFPLDTLTKFMIDREDYTATPTIALFRLFLEPLGEPVDKWSMSIIGDPNVDHSVTYTFADKFTNTYVPAIKATLAAVLGNKTCAQLQQLSNNAFGHFK